MSITTPLATVGPISTNITSLTAAVQQLAKNMNLLAINATGNPPTTNLSGAQIFATFAQITTVNNLINQINTDINTIQSALSDIDSALVVLNNLVIPASTVAELPTNAQQGARAFVTDSVDVYSGANIGTVVAGNHSNLTPVYYDGSNWRIG